MIFLFGYIHALHTNILEFSKSKAHASRAFKRQSFSTTEENKSLFLYIAIKTEMVIVLILKDLSLIRLNDFKWVKESIID